VEGQTDKPKFLHLGHPKKTVVSKTSLHAHCHCGCRGKGSQFFPLLPAAGSPYSPSVKSQRQQPGPPPGRQLLQCQQCSFSALYPSYLKRHQRSHTGERPFKCNHCGKAFAWQNQLNVHLRTHTGERPHQCHLCPSAFTHKSALDSHVRSHTGERPFRCRLCPKAFTRRRWRKAHETREHKTHLPGTKGDAASSFMLVLSLMPDCHRVCQWKGSEFLFPPVAGPSPFLGGHGVQHSPPPGRQPLQCQQCSFMALYPSYLKRHQRSHTGECPFSCSHCNKAFVTKTQLDVHLRTHTGERPYQCHLCPSTFTQQAHLDSHVRSHTGEQPFRCRFCPKAFSRRLLQKTHEAREHETQPL
ncbi:uncharacterized protein LOC144166323, partial [Haemaphysalis longicornis]